MGKYQRDRAMGGRGGGVMGGSNETLLDRSNCNCVQILTLKRLYLFSPSVPVSPFQLSVLFY